MRKILIVGYIRRAILQQAVGYIVERHLETLGQGRRQ